MLPVMKQRTRVGWRVVGWVVASGLACSGVPPLPEVVAPEGTPVDAELVDTGTTVPVASGEEPAGDVLPAPVPEGEQATGDPTEGSGERPVASPTEPVPPAPGTDDKGAKKAPAPAPSGITRVSDASWKVTPALVEQWKEDPYRLSSVREQGDGWELLGVRQGNAWHLGMRNRDVLLEVNGHKLNTKTQLLMAYLALKNDRAFDLVFSRQGNRMVHHYEIIR